jgi:hypothetical protein
MKKIAFMFAAAAMFVACGEKAAPVVLNAEDSTKVQQEVEQAIAAELGEAPVLGEDTTAEAKASFEEAVKAYDAKKAELEATKEQKLAEAYAKALEAKKAAPADSTANK